MLLKNVTIKVISALHTDLPPQPMPRTVIPIAMPKMTRNLLLAPAGSMPITTSWRLACLLLLWIVGCQHNAFAGSHKSADPTVRPAVLYHNYCSVCHGDRGDGKSRAQNSLNPPPLDFTTSAAAQIPRDRMIESVTNGRNGTAMSAWKSQLSQREIESIVDYVRNTFMPAIASPDSSRGRTIYSKNCSVCHGEKGDGRSRAQGSLNPPPRDFTAPGVLEELSQQRMITSVTFGRANTAMAGFKAQLSKEDISAVVEYIREGFMRNSSTVGISGIQHGRKDAAPNGSNAPKSAEPRTAKAGVSAPMVVDMSAPMPNALIGNADKGKHFYMQNCATCHGVAGDGQGPRAYFIVPKPRNFLHPASRQEFNRVKLFKMISEGERGTEMPAWNKVLTPQEIANVAEFVFQQFIQSNATNSNSTKVVK